jgi:hypothetical protein
MTLNEITLPDDLIWIDEFDDPNMVGQSETISLGGQVIVQTQARVSGRPITLQGSEKFGWVRRDTLLQIQVLAADPEAALALVMRGGAARPVVFRAPRLKAVPLYEHADPDGNHPYIVTLYFMEV